MKGRTIDGIYLRPDKNNGHEIMSLKSGQVITRPKVTVLPVTSNVINTVEEIAHEQEFKELQFKSRTGNILSDADWIAGVDYDDYENEEEEEEEDDEYKPPNENEEEDDENYDEEIDEDEVHALYDETNPNLAPIIE